MSWAGNVKKILLNKEGRILYCGTLQNNVECFYNLG